MAKCTKENKVMNLSELHENPDNPNCHPTDQIKSMAKSLETYGQYYPIICDEDGMILCGHGKLKALQEHGDTTAEVVVLRGLSAKQKLKLMLEDNKIQSLSYVTFGKVDEIIKKIGDVDIIGFAPDYLNSIIHANTPQQQAIPDNMGVQLDKPIAPKTEEQRQEELQEQEPQKVQKQEEEFNQIDAGMQTARTIVCPHCGQTITL